MSEMERAKEVAEPEHGRDWSWVAAPGIVAILCLWFFTQDWSGWFVVGAVLFFVALLVGALVLTILLVADYLDR